MFDYNFDHNAAMYTRPVLDAYWAEKYKGYLTKGMSDAELADYETTLHQLKNYEKIYGIVEYCSKLHEGMTTLQKRIMT